MNRAVVMVLLATICSPALGETHITVDTAAGKAGDPISIRAGYYQTEAIGANRYALDATGRLLHNGNPDVYVLNQPIRTGPFAGFYGSLDETQLELTTNFYANTGRLDGGDFRYEITSVTPIPGGGGVDGLQFGFAAPEEGLYAISSDSTRAGRSLDLGVNTLYDDEVMVADRPGLYDVTLVAWDANAKYTDSAPVTFRITVAPEPTAAAMWLFVIGVSFARRTR
jgi:hypothetical protein